MNPNVAMANMNAMGGPVGNPAPIPMMNNGPMGPQPAGMAGPAGPGMQRQVPGPPDRGQLNKYIYDYFIRQGMYGCARALLSADHAVAKNEGGKNCGAMGNGVEDDPMDADSKDDLDAKLPEGLPPANVVPQVSDNSFLYDWFCLFWDLFNAQHNKTGTMAVHQYVNHTQAQSRLKQNQQQDMLRQMRPDLNVQHQLQQMAAMRSMQQNGAAVAMNMKTSNLARAAMANNQNPQTAMQMMHAKQGQMQREQSEMDAMRQRGGSPGSDAAAPSPSKRPRLDGAPFNPNQPGMMPIGRPVVQPMMMAGHPGGPPPNSNPNHILIAAGVNTAGLTQGQLQNFAAATQGGQAKSIAAYSQNLQQHHGTQMPPGKQMPQGQGSPGMMAHQPGDGINVNAYYNATGGEVVRIGAGVGSVAGTGGGGGGGGGGGPNGQQGAAANNHALQDYQMQLMLLEQQNKKRLLMARQEQDSIGGGGGGGMPRDGPGGPQGPSGPPGGGGPVGAAGGANGQFSDSSPQAVRTGADPNPADQMKRGTPQMNSVGIPSPMADGVQSRDSPNPAAFGMPGQMDPGQQQQQQQQQQQFSLMQMNGMRPPNAHPGQPGQFNGPPQQMMPARQGQPVGLQPGQPGGGPGNPPGQWQQGGPASAQMVPQGSQGQMQGTPQQRAMPPPSVLPVPGPGARNSTASPGATPKMTTPSPALATKPKPTKKEGKKEGKVGKKKTSNAASAATPAVPDNNNAADGEPPATPITPGNNFKTGPVPTVQPLPNGQPGASAAGPGPVPQPPPAAPQHSDPNHSGPTFGMENGAGMVDFQMEFANPLATTNALEDFDFDSFLHDGDGDTGTFDFNATFSNLEGTGEIGTTD